MAMAKTRGSEKEEEESEGRNRGKKYQREEWTSVMQRQASLVGDGGHNILLCSYESRQKSNWVSCKSREESGKRERNRKKGIRGEKRTHTESGKKGKK